MGLIEKQIKEIKLMMERLESPRLTETELQIKKNLLIESVHSNKPPIKGESKPRFGGMKLKFDSEVDKALYIVLNPKLKSEAEPEFLRWVSSLGYTQEEKESEGENIKDYIKNKIKKTKGFPGWSGGDWVKMTGEINIPKMGSEPKPKEK